MNEGRLSLERLAATTSENPARIYGIYPRKGSFLVGSDGDLTIIDLEKRWKIRSGDLVTACGWTPYEGYETQGLATDVIIRGEMVLEDGEVASREGQGTFIPRSC